MGKYKIVKKMPILLLAGILAVSMAPWTVCAETPENEVNLEEMQDGTEKKLQMNSNTGESDAAFLTEADGGGADADPQGEPSNDEKDADPEAEADNGETDGESQKSQDQNDADGDNQSEEESSGEGDFSEGMPGDPSGLTEGSTVFSQVDPATGVAADAVEDVFPIGTALYVTPIESGGEYDQISTLMSMIADQFKVCDIRFINVMDYSMTEPVGTVRVSIPVPEGFDTGHLSVSKLNEDGTRTEISFEVADGKAVFQTDSAGTFLIAQMKVLPESLAMTEKISRVELAKRTALSGSSTSGSALTARPVSPKTGDDNGIALWSGVMGAAVVLILVLVVIRRKK